MENVKYRVWYICQVGVVGEFYVNVESPEEAWKTLNILWEYDTIPASGLEYYDEDDQDWREWYDDIGLNIIEHFDLERYFG